MSKKVANKSAVPATIRLVKREGASIGFSDGIKPAGCVDNAHELTFQLGKFVFDSGRFVIGQRSTPNIKNPATYANIGDAFKLESTDTGNFLLSGQWTTIEANPEYSTLPISIFFSLDSKEAPYVIANPGTTITLQGIAANTQIPKATLLGSMGQYFNDDRLYYPVWSGTVKQLVATWLASKQLGFPELSTLGPRLVSQDVKVTIEQPIGTVTITGVNDLFVGDKSQMTYSFTPANSVVKEAIWHSENPDIAEFDGAEGLLNVKGMGSVDITLTLVDSLDNRISTTRTYAVQQHAKPLTLRYAVNSAAVNLSFDSAAPTAGWIDWGDGTVEPLSDAPSHQYHGAQTPTVKVWPTAPLLGANVTGQTDSPLTDVVSWGDTTYAQIQVGSASLKSVPTTAPLGLTSGRYMFSGSIVFNQNINAWNVSNVTDMTQMFVGCATYDQPMDLWNVAKVTEFVGMFQDCNAFNKSINSWVMTKATNLSYMFAKCSLYNQPMDRLSPAGNANVNASYMLQGCTSFNSAIAGFIKPAVQMLEGLLSDCISFNQSMAGVSFGNATNITGMFKGCKVFNGLLGAKWFEKTFTNVSSLFEGCTLFNQPIAQLKTISTNVSYLLAKCPAFNQPMNDFVFDGKVNATGMFDGCSNFTSDLSDWDVSELQEASRMFAGTASFDSELNWWCARNIDSEPSDFATGSFLARSNYPKWGTCPIRDLKVTINQIKPYFISNESGTLTYSTNQPYTPTTVEWASSDPTVVSVNASTGEYAAVSKGVVTITVTLDGIYSGSQSYNVIQEVTPAVFRVNTAVDAANSLRSIVTVKLNNIDTIRDGDVIINWGDDQYSQLTNGQTATHEYSTENPTVYDIAVMPLFPEGTDLIVSGSVVEIVQFGEADLNIAATYLTKVPAALPTSMTKLKLTNCKNLNDPNIVNWDVSRLTDMSEMFKGCTAFNQPIGTWNVSNVTNMAWMFGDDQISGLFNQDISDWDVSNVENMDFMFEQSDNFVISLRYWCVAKIPTRPQAFHRWQAGWWDESHDPVWGTCPSRTAKVVINDLPESIGIRDIVQLTATLTDDQGPIPITSVVWSNANNSPSFAVSTDGLLTAAYNETGEGSVRVLINNFYSLTAPVKVVSPTVSINAPSDVEVGTVATASYSLSPEYHITNPFSARWSTTTDTLLTVSRDTGEYTALAAGSAKLAVTVEFLWSDEVSFEITEPVVPVTPLTGFTGGTEFRVKTAYPIAVKIGDDDIDYIPIDPGNEFPEYEYVVPVTESKPFVINSDNASEPLPGLNVISGVKEITTWHSNNQGSYYLGLDIEKVPTSAPPDYTEFGAMFKGSSKFNDPNISQWNVSGYVHLSAMFDGCSSFNQPLTNWIVNEVEDASEMFKGCTAFNSDISNLSFDSLMYIEGMFRDAVNFNQPVNNVIKTNNVASLDNVFNGCSKFNQPLDQWNVSKVTKFGDLFRNAVLFDQDLSGWDVSKGIIFWRTFEGAVAFDHSLSAWNVESAQYMEAMFHLTTYVDRHDLSRWCVTHVISLPSNFQETITVPENLPVWGTCPGPAPQPGNSDETVLSVDVTEYPNATDRVIRVAGGVEGARLLSPSSGAIATEVVTGAIQYTLPEGYVGDVAFKTTSAQSPIITIPSESLAKPILRKLVKFSETVKRISYSSKAAFTVPKVLPSFVTTLERMFANATNFNDPNIGLWDTTNVTSISGTFLNASNFNQPLANWNVSNVTAMTSVFEGAAKFNQPLNAWIITKVKDLTSVFKGAKAFNQNINTWDVSNVVDLSTLFLNASNFNQPLNDWDVGNVTTMWFTFSGASAFNQELNAWNTGKCTSMISMFQNAISFNKDISGWDVSKVALFNGMFYGAEIFNQPLANWVTTAATNMNEMFYDAIKFAQDLSAWCVTNITAEPSGFATNAPGIIKPVWGTCPVAQYTLTINHSPELMVGRDQQMTYTLTPTTTVVYTDWAVDDPAIATIDAAGKLTGVSDGVTVVRLKLNSYYTGSLSVTVIAEQIILAPTNVTITES